MKKRPAAERIKLVNIFSEDPSQPSPNERVRPDQPSPAERYDDEQDEFSFASLSRTFWANKWGILLTSALFAGLARLVRLYGDAALHRHNPCRAGDGREEGR